MPAARKRRKKPTRKQEHAALLRRHRDKYDALLLAQGGGCAICGRPPSERRRLDMDHDHKEMFIRGLLCTRCNRALTFWITVAWLRKAADYLARGDYLKLH